MSVDLMPNRYRPGEADLAPREADLIARRDGVLGASYRLQYRNPVHFVRGEGMWLFDPDGPQGLVAGVTTERLPAACYRSRVIMSHAARDTQGAKYRFRSSSLRHRSRWSGSPPSIGTTQVRHVPVSQLDFGL